MNYINKRYIENRNTKFFKIHYVISNNESVYKENGNKIQVFEKQFGIVFVSIRRIKLKIYLYNK